MIDFEPKYITFDCYGTLTKFRMADMAREMFADRLQGDGAGASSSRSSRAIASTKCSAPGSRIAT